MKRIIILILFLSFSLVSVLWAQETETLGVVANNNTNCIQLINPVTMELSQHYLKGQLGSYGGGLFDVVIAPNGKTAIVSNFGDSTLYFIRIADGFNGEPTLYGNGYVSFFAEDMDFIPGTNYVLVTDGGFSPVVAVIDYTKGTLIKRVNLKNNSAQSVAVSPDGKLVLFADYFGSAIHSYSISEDGSFTFKETQLIAPARPVNVSISPDGKTVIVANSSGRHVPTFLIDSQFNLCFKGFVSLPAQSAQSCVFNKAGDKAYYLSNNQIHGTQVFELNVEGRGIVTYSGTAIKVEPARGTSQLFGVESIAIDPSNKYLYVTNPTVSGGIGGISVIDIAKKEQVNFLYTTGIPVGIAFTTITKTESN